MTEWIRQIISYFRQTKGDYRQTQGRCDGIGTPILTGKDAVEFDKAIKENELTKVPAEDYQRAKEVYNRVRLL